MARDREDQPFTPEVQEFQQLEDQLGLTDLYERVCEHQDDELDECQCYEDLLQQLYEGDVFAHELFMLPEPIRGQYLDWFAKYRYRPDSDYYPSDSEVTDSQATSYSLQSSQWSQDE